VKRVLAIDGGGMHGIIPAYILREIEVAISAPIGRRFDLIAGTSTGGIIALGLTSPGGMTAQQMLEFYWDHGPEIFKKRWTFPLTNKYRPDALRRLLRQKLGAGAMLSESRPHCMVTAYHMVDRRLEVFKSWRGEAIKRWMAAMATSAAPTYFPPFMDWWDGGVSANNPAMCAYVEARRLWPDEPIRVVSLGTGTSVKSIGPRSRAARRPAAFALHKMISVFMDGQMDAPDYQLKHLLGRDYTRLQGPFRKASDEMDDANERQRAALVSDAQDIIRQHRHAYDDLIEELAA